ncbi:MAG: SH3 domain-containing protein [Clostridiaceae bacterium]|jgi:uncharacterized YkwD family protein|nr:SH3 domain-containing protein [Clostridiaceae bacterium]
MKKKMVLVVLCILIVSTTCYASTDGSNTTTQLAFERIGYDAATVTAGRLNLREGPSTSYPSICKLEKGQAVTVMGKLGDWYAVYFPDTGVVGAVDGRYIELANGDAITVAKDGIEAKKPPKDKEKDKDKLPSPNNTSLSEDEQKLLELVNKARADKKLEPLTVDANLMNVARMKAKDMVDNNYFSHQSPKYGSPFDMMRQFDNVFKSAGENIAGNKTVEGAFKAWMSSESHKNNILNAGFKVTGIGIENSVTYGKILVQQFIGK